MIGRSHAHTKVRIESNRIESNRRDKTRHPHGSWDYGELARFGPITKHGTDETPTADVYCGVRYIAVSIKIEPTDRPAHNSSSLPIVLSGAVLLLL